MKIYKFTLLIIAIFFFLPAHAWRIENGYLIVERGDNLSKIAHNLYGKGIDYKILWENRVDTAYKNPNRIYDGMRFKLSFLKQEQVITKHDTLKLQPIINNYKATNEGFPFDQLWNLIWFVLGFLSSIYATIIFERWNRFKEIVREIGLKRTYSEHYPIEKNPTELKTSFDNAVEFWHFIESKEWALRANGHWEAAREVRKLQSFAYKVARHIEKMYNLQENKKNISLCFSAFQIEYSKIYDKEYKQFEDRLKPNIKSLLVPYPHPIAPKSGYVPADDYFENLWKNYE